MADLSERPEGDAGELDADNRDLESALDGITKVLLGIAAGRFDVRAERDNSGDPLDVLAFLVNATAEETAGLVQALRHEREELAKAQEQLIQAAKLAALGQLAGGVAHELNQPLTVIRALTQMIGEQGDTPVAEHVSDLELIGKSAQRMGRIIDNVRTFARQSSFQRRPMPAEQGLADALELLGAQIVRQGIEIEQHLEPDLPPVMGDVERLQQVFLNLLTNARDALAALPDGAPRVIRIQAHRDDAFVVYAVEDNGGGIPEQHATRIFEPFFTTKELGQGTGLGLSVSHGIVAEHGGELRCEASASGGARFTVRIPVASTESRT